MSAAFNGPGTVTPSSYWSTASLNPNTLAFQASATAPFGANQPFLVATPANFGAGVEGLALTLTGPGILESLVMVDNALASNISARLNVDNVDIFNNAANPWICGGALAYGAVNAMQEINAAANLFAWRPIYFKTQLRVFVTSSANNPGQLISFNYTWSKLQ